MPIPSARKTPPTRDSRFRKLPLAQKKGKLLYHALRSPRYHRFARRYHDTTTDEVRQALRDYAGKQGDATVIGFSIRKAFKKVKKRVKKSMPAIKKVKAMVDKLAKSKYAQSLAATIPVAGPGVAAGMVTYSKFSKGLEGPEQIMEVAKLAAAGNPMAEAALQNIQTGASLVKNLKAGAKQEAAIEVADKIEQAQVMKNLGAKNKAAIQRVTLEALNRSLAF